MKFETSNLKHSFRYYQFNVTSIKMGKENINLKAIGSSKCCLLPFFIGQGSIKKSYFVFWRMCLFCCIIIAFHEEHHFVHIQVKSYNPIHNNSSFRDDQFWKNHIVLYILFERLVRQLQGQILKSIYKDIMHYPSSKRRSSSSFFSSYPYYVTLFA